jgi:hypothetical protein
VLCLENIEQFSLISDVLEDMIIVIVEVLSDLSMGRSSSCGDSICRI